MTASTLFRYLCRTFMLHFLVLMAILAGIIYVVETVELLRRAAIHEEATFARVLAMAAMKLPHTGGMLLPFGILFGAIHTCWKLNRTHELVVIRAAGFSVWQFLGPILFCAALTGVFATAVLNPVSSIMLTKFRQMENAHFNTYDSFFTVSTTGIWLRQPFQGGYALIHADAIDQDDWRMSDVIVYFLDDADNFQKRVDAKEAFLRDGHWDIRAARTTDRAGSRREGAAVRLGTSLTPRKIEESFADPDTISFWNIPEYIKVMEDAGFPSARLHIHFQSLLAQPLLFAAMILLAATFSLRPPRFAGTGLMISLGVLCGFFIFFMESMLGAFGASQKIPVFLAAWTPATVGLLLGLAALLHMEDG